MRIFDVFRGPSEQEANWSAAQETENQAIEFNIGSHPEIQKYLAEKGNSDLIGEKATSYEGMSKQRSDMLELTNINNGRKIRKGYPSDRTVSFGSHH